MAKKKRGWGGRILVVLGWMLGLFLGISVTLVAVFRFVPVPVSALMVQRRVESWSSDKRYTSHHTWVPLEDISPSLGAAVIAALVLVLGILPQYLLKLCADAVMRALSG